jgi:hypothetical protein
VERGVAPGLEADRDRYMESLSVEQEMNLLLRLRPATDP